MSRPLLGPAFYCEPDLPRTPEHPFGFACDDEPGGVSCHQYEQVKKLRAELEEALALLSAKVVPCLSPCCAPGRMWTAARHVVTGDEPLPCAEPCCAPGREWTGRVCVVDGAEDGPDSPLPGVADLRKNRR